MPSYDENYVQVIDNVATGSFTGTQVWIIVSCVLAIIGGIFFYITFVGTKKTKYDGFLAKTHEFFNFKITIFEALLKAVYLIGALSLTLSSFAYIGSNFFTFIFILTFGNIFLRIVFEVLLKLFILAKDVNEINKKIVNQTEKNIKKVDKQKKDEK